jgi:hypothetical protein
MAVRKTITSDAGRFGLILSSDLCNRALASWSGELEPTAEAKFSGTQNEKLWREFFSDPSQWWDHRSEKR